MFIYKSKSKRHCVAKKKESKNEVSNFRTREAKHQERNRRIIKCRVVENTMCANLKWKKLSITFSEKRMKVWKRERKRVKEKGKEKEKKSERKRQREWKREKWSCWRDHMCKFELWHTRGAHANDDDRWNHILGE